MQRLNMGLTNQASGMQWGRSSSRAMFKSNRIACGLPLCVGQIICVLSCTCGDVNAGIGAKFRLPNVEALINSQKRVFGEVVIQQDGKKVLQEQNGKTTPLPDSATQPQAPTFMKLEVKNDGTSKIIEQRDAAAAALDRHSPDLGIKSESESFIRLKETMAKLEEVTAATASNGPGRHPASVQSPSQPDLKQMKPLLDQAITDTQTLYQEAAKNNNPEDKTRIAGIYMRLQEQRKSYYGSRDADNYPPATYLGIYHSALSACRVVLEPDESENVTTSGCLIGDGLVLTCAHDVSDAVELAVEFPFSKDPATKLKRKARRIAVGERRSQNEGPLDYALLEFDPDPQDPDKADRQPMKLTRQRPSLDAAVFALGHPNGGALEVHDFSRVVMPFMLKETDRDGFLIRIHADLLRQNILSNSNLATEDVARSEFEHRYKLESPFYIYRNPYLQSNAPVFGVDTDTFHGDSGCPIILRKSGHLCGILIEGEPDKAHYHSSTILAHERCVPMGVIIDQLDQKLPGWVDKYHVKIQ